MYKRIDTAKCHNDPNHNDVTAKATSVDADLTALIKLLLFAIHYASN